MIVRLEKHRIDEIAVGCARVGCQEEYHVPRGMSTFAALPEGWGSLVVCRGSQFDPMNRLKADVDSLFCPKHYKELLSILIIGQVQEMLQRGLVEIETAK